MGMLEDEGVKGRRGEGETAPVPWHGVAGVDEATYTYLGQLHSNPCRPCGTVLCKRPWARSVPEERPRGVTIPGFYEWLAAQGLANLPMGYPRRDDLRAAFSAGLNHGLAQTAKMPGSDPDGTRYAEGWRQGHFAGFRINHPEAAEWVARSADEYNRSYEAGRQFGREQMAVIKNADEGEEVNRLRSDVERLEGLLRVARLDLVHANQRTITAGIQTATARLYKTEMLKAIKAMAPVVSGVKLLADHWSMHMMFNVALLKTTGDAAKKAMLTKADFERWEASAPLIGSVTPNEVDTRSASWADGYGVGLKDGLKQGENALELIVPADPPLPSKRCREMENALEFYAKQDLWQESGSERGVYRKLITGTGHPANPARRALGWATISEQRVDDPNFEESPKGRTTNAGAPETEGLARDALARLNGDVILGRAIMDIAAACGVAVGKGSWADTVNACTAAYQAAIPPKGQTTNADYVRAALNPPSLRTLQDYYARMEVLLRLLWKAIDSSSLGEYGLESAQPWYYALRAEVARIEAETGE